jgi:hypothetical protein
MVDRLLLVLLVVLLPLGVFGSKEIVSRWQGQAVDPQTEYLQEVEALLTQLIEKRKSGGGALTEVPRINLMSVTVASASGTVTVMGSSPTEYGITVSATVLPPYSDTDEVLGGTVALAAIRPKQDGIFTYTYDLPSGRDGVLELTFRSGEAVAVAQIDLETKTYIEE